MLRLAYCQKKLGVIGSIKKLGVNGAIKLYDAKSEQMHFTWTQNVISSPNVFRKN